MRAIFSGGPISTRGRRVLWAMLGVGLAARFFLAFTYVGSAYDIGSFELVRHALSADPLHTYTTLQDSAGRWPYPPGFFPFIWVLGKVSGLTGLAFHGLINLPSIAADVAIAFVAQAFLGRRGASERERLAAFGLVMLGPSFAAISGYHGQMDSFAILPAVIAVVVWSDDVPNRALIAGLLLGAGAALKTVPLLVVLALLPTVRSRREAFVLVGGTGAILALSLAPFLISEPGPLRTALKYVGLQGQGGLTLAVQPDFARRWLTDPGVHLNAASQFLLDYARPWNLAWIAGAGFVLWRRRVAAVPASVILWLAFFVFATAFFFQYLIWGLPFLLLAGRLQLAAGIQLLALVPTCLFYLGPWEDRAVVVPYATLMIGLWILCVVALARRVAAPTG